MLFTNFKNRQSGIALMPMLFWGVIIVMGVVFGAQVGISYLDKRILQEAITKTAQEVKSDKDGSSTKKFREVLARKLSVESSTFSQDDIKISKSGDNFIVEVSLIKEIGISDSVKFVLDLSFVQEE